MLRYANANMESSEFGKNWGWVLAAGIGYVIIGLIAFRWPVSSTVGLTFVLGVIFLVAGIVQGIHAFQIRKEAGTFWRLLESIAALAAGILMLRYPAAGMLGITIVLAFYFLVGAATKFVLAFDMRPLKGWVWVLLSAASSLILGIYILAAFPVSALWVPGFILGVDLVIEGLSLTRISFDLKNFHQRLEGRTSSTLATR